MIKLVPFTSIFLLTFASIAVVFAQTPFKKIKAKGSYIHTYTGTSFEEKIGEYTRVDIYSVDKKEKGISSIYQHNTSMGMTTLSIDLYPTPGNEEQLRSAYQSSVSELTNGVPDSPELQQYPASFQSGDYKVIGYTALLMVNRSLITIFECGQWLFKIKVNSDYLDSTQIKSLEKQVVEVFKPTNLVKKAPLVWKPSIHFAPAAFRDSVMLGSVMGSAYKKLEWAKQNMSSQERDAGFPDLYLNLHIASLTEFIRFEKRVHVYGKHPATKQYLSELNQIVEAGFLEEFIMEQYNKIMIVPANITFEFDAYEVWKLTHPITINLNEKYSVITFKTD
ncbi:hypothetical protein QNI16_01360 [Cytophagaceae bacterium YF14B1]|uniref:Uncharacterized protein n=1 Tax=Xanthocytophaga flava TaxID=3048013 RepID=A0AAE3QLT1_9BACT|nr:hypothetical protein [Xanthocytophaga flavus]MDJ1479109.1 hypothetical protein [Xanthocytophaga flavus]